MPKLPGKRFSSNELSDADLLDTVVADENDCLLFEQRLNELMDLRCSASEISSDGHLLVCCNCQAMLEDYQAMLEASKLLGCVHFEDASIDVELPVAVGRASSLGGGPSDSAGSQFFGWSTLLAVLFVFWGASAGVTTNRGLSEAIPSASLAGVEVEQVESANRLSLAGLLGDSGDFANHLVGANPLLQSAPASRQPFFEMPTGRLLAAGLPTVDLASVDIGHFSYIGKCWQHASRLPGIEPWQHSVNFAIGWLNQPTFPREKTQSI